MAQAQHYPTSGGEEWHVERLPPGSLYGEALRSRVLTGLVLSERRYAPFFRTPKHAHGHALLCLVIQGGYTETFGTRTRTCEPPLLIFHPADEIHTEQFHQIGGRLFIIELEPKWLERVRDQAQVIEEAAEFRSGDLVYLGMRLHREFLHGADDLSQLILEGLVLTILGEASRRPSVPPPQKPPAWLLQVREMLHARFTESLTLGEIAQSVGVHPVYLAQMFHKYFKCTVGAYIRQLRLDFARRELATSDAPLCQIALAAGFSDQSHFTRTFKRYVGVTPAQYRESLLGPHRSAKPLMRRSAPDHFLLF
jgi:AraC family transcriptional regulator